MLSTQLFPSKWKYPFGCRKISHDEISLITDRKYVSYTKCLKQQLFPSWCVVITSWCVVKLLNSAIWKNRKRSQNRKYTHNLRFRLKNMKAWITKVFWVMKETQKYDTRSMIILISVKLPPHFYKIIWVEHYKKFLLIFLSFIREFKNDFNRHCD